ncbi:MAG: lysozyme [Alphaproteobacteria bacterium]|nr:lysozyme [Alphaproteobacteria bacterium]MBO4644234.1 lysozyme [Alphaproteobacteria bacterium]
MISEKGLKAIKTFEGYSPLEYTCVAGKRTIGFGHVLKPNESYVCGVSEEQAEELLIQDLKTVETAVDMLVKVPLKEYQRDALVSFAYNIGAYAFQRSTLLKELNAGNYEQVPKQLMRWIYVNGKPCYGLSRRRQAEAALFENKRERKRSFFYERKKK